MICIYYKIQNCCIVKLSPSFANVHFADVLFELSSSIDCTVHMKLLFIYPNKCDAMPTQHCILVCYICGGLVCLNENPRISTYLKRTRVMHLHVCVCYLSENENDVELETRSQIGLPSKCNWFITNFEHTHT